MGDYAENTQQVDICCFYRKGIVQKGQQSIHLKKQHLLINWTEVLGGRSVRPYWVCPLTGKNAGVLYYGFHGFACRQYYNLPYWNQTQSRSNRTSAAAHAIREKLGCPGGLHLPLVKPKGMRWKTFEKWQEKYQRAAGGYLLGLEKRLDRLIQ